MLDLILGEIVQYQADSLDYMVFVPLDPDHRLCILVISLQTIAPNSFKAGTECKSLWKRVIQASMLPMACDYLAIFDLLEDFDGWLITQFKTGPQHKSGDTMPATVDYLLLNHHADQAIGWVVAQPWLTQGDTSSPQTPDVASTTVRHPL
ncbi:MAG: hypothetical protein ACKO9H_18835, partial [Planctomycetota bacterium]